MLHKSKLMELVTTGDDNDAENYINSLPEAERENAQNIYYEVIGEFQEFLESGEEFKSTPEQLDARIKEYSVRIEMVKIREQNYLLEEEKKRKYLN